MVISICTLMAICDTQTHVFMFSAPAVIILLVQAQAVLYPSVVGLRLCVRSERFIFDKFYFRKRNLMAKVFIGQIVHTKSFNDFEVIPHGFVAVNSGGLITGVGDNYDLWCKQNSHQVETVQLSEDQFLMPGFVDCHIHGPQMAQIGLGLDMPLLEWLNTYTFPLEAKYSDKDFAQKVYAKVVETTINSGTTLASYFGTNHKDSTMILAKEALRQGQRALVGKTCSNCNSPDYYSETLKESLSSTKDFVEDFKSLRSDLVKPTITPRFALSCTKDLLKSLGDFAREHNLHIQSHISESIAEIDFVKKLFSRTYAEVYDDAGLLTNKTVMAHAVHLDDVEITMLRDRGTSVAHCPASNTMLGSGLCDVLRLIAGGVKVGLGTDVSGGNSASIQDAILRAMDVSRHIEFLKKQTIKGTEHITSTNVASTEYTPINYKQAIFLATLGGAEALALENVTGNFVVGKAFDALLIDTSLNPLHNFSAYNKMSQEQSPEIKLLELVQKFIYVGDDRNIVKVYVSGKQVKKNSDLK